MNNLEKIIIGGLILVFSAILISFIINPDLFQDSIPKRFCNGLNKSLTDYKHPIFGTLDVECSNFVYKDIAIEQKKECISKDKWGKCLNSEWYEVYSYSIEKEKDGFLYQSRQEVRKR